MLLHIPLKMKGNYMTLKDNQHNLYPQIKSRYSKLFEVCTYIKSYGFFTEKIYVWGFRVNKKNLN